MKIDEVFGRLYKLAGVKNDAALAKELGVSPQAVANSRKRESIPYDKICSYAENRGHSVDYILFGKSEVDSSNEAGPAGQLNTFAKAAEMADLLSLIFRELDNELFLQDRMSDPEEEAFWFLASVYQRVISQLPKDALMNSEEAHKLARYFAKEEVDHYRRVLAIASKEAKSNEPSVPHLSDQTTSTTTSKGAVDQKISGDGHQIAGGDISNKGGVRFGREYKK